MRRLRTRHRSTCVRLLLSLVENIFKNEQQMIVNAQNAATEARRLQAQAVASATAAGQPPPPPPPPPPRGPSGRHLLVKILATFVRQLFCFLFCLLLS